MQVIFSGRTPPLLFTVIFRRFSHYREPSDLTFDKFRIKSLRLSGMPTAVACQSSFIQIFLFSPAKQKGGQGPARWNKGSKLEL
jgi:hypothetical protein